MIIKEVFKTVKKETPLENSKNTFVNEALKEERLNTRTTNGMKAYSTTGSALVNLFNIAGNSNGGLVPLFERAYKEDPILALKLALFIRDIRGGMGRRQSFREIVSYITDIPMNDASHLQAFIKKIPEIGRWDDLVYVDSQWLNIVLNLIKEGLENENTQGLCAKWLPRQGAFANMLRKELGFKTPKEYRKKLVELSNTVEQKICANKWNKVKYNTVPSIAFKRYTNAFMRHDEERFQEFLNKANTGEEKVNAQAIYPYQVIQNLRNNDLSAEVQWKNLPDFLSEDSNILVICDDSGSMLTRVAGETTALDVARSLAIYTSERLKSEFKDLFMTFSRTPRWMNLKRFNTLKDKVEYCKEHCEIENTNIVAAFDLILNTAIERLVDPKDMPKTLLIISDMQFDNCVEWDTSAFNVLKNKYKEAGYEMPRIIFWNLSCYTDNFPVEYNDKGVALMSGFSPSLLKYLNYKDLTPMNLIKEILNNDRYNI